MSILMYVRKSIMLARWGPLAPRSTGPQEICMHTCTSKCIYYTIRLYVHTVYLLADIITTQWYINQSYVYHKQIFMHGYISSTYIHHLHIIVYLAMRCSVCVCVSACLPVRVLFTTTRIRKSVSKCVHNGC